MSFVKMWSDEDMVDLRIEASDGASTFSNEVYVGHRHLKDTVAGLDLFKDQVYGGIYDMRFGKFGPEYASGAFHARLHFQNGSLYITVSAQSGYFDFGKKHVARESALYLTTEPAQLDEFIRALRAVSDGHSDNATLATFPPC
ncbi:MAG TPA: hypothetical protein VF800_16185 [Telluria sp.]